MNTNEMNLQSIAELPKISGLGDGDYLLTVSDGEGKLLPAGNFSGGGVDAMIGPGQSGDDMVYTRGSYEALAAKIKKGELPTLHFVVPEGDVVTLMCPLTMQYSDENGILAIMIAGDSAAVILLAPDGTISFMG